jgi:hypothetical protein
LPIQYKKLPGHKTDLAKIEPPQGPLSLKQQTENRERILKSLREKKITYKGKPIKITADFSMETLKARRVWSEVFQSLNENNFISRILYPAKLLKIDAAIKIFHDKQKRKQYMTIKSPLQRILQGILYTENESKHTHERTGSLKPQEKTRQVIREYH